VLQPSTCVQSVIDRQPGMGMQPVPEQPLLLPGTPLLPPELPLVPPEPPLELLEELPQSVPQGRLLTSVLPGSPLLPPEKQRSVVPLLAPPLADPPLLPASPPLPVPLPPPALLVLLPVLPLPPPSFGSAFPPLLLLHAKKRDAATLSAESVTIRSASWLMPGPRRSGFLALAAPFGRMAP
jgi:hypothetical protein